MPAAGEPQPEREQEQVSEDQANAQDAQRRQGQGAVNRRRASRVVSGTGSTVG
jgi:hypothetical protein